MLATIIKTLPRDITLGEALDEAERIRLENIHSVKLRNVHKYQERHHEELLDKRRIYRETHKVEIAQKKKDARLLKKTQAGLLHQEVRQP